jgi:hypothetical protein
MILFSQEKMNAIPRQIWSDGFWDDERWQKPTALAGNVRKFTEVNDFLVIGLSVQSELQIKKTNGSLRWDLWLALALKDSNPKRSSQWMSVCA